MTLLMTQVANFISLICYLCTLGCLSHKSKGDGSSWQMRSARIHINFIFSIATIMMVFVNTSGKPEQPQRRKVGQRKPWE